jgi:hypothetical protein
VVAANKGSSCFYDHCTFESLVSEQSGLLYILSESKATVRLQEATFRNNKGQLLSSPDPDAGTFITDKAYKVYYESGGVNGSSIISNEQNSEGFLRPEDPWYTGMRKVGFLDDCMEALGPIDELH